MTRGSILRPGLISAPPCPECNPGPVDYYWLDCWYTFFPWAGCFCVAGEAFSFDWFQLRQMGLCYERIGRGSFAVRAFGTGTGTLGK